MSQRWVTRDGITETTPSPLHAIHRVGQAFPTVTCLCLHEGLGALDFMMSHFLAVSLRTSALPMCLLGLGWGPALGGPGAAACVACFSGTGEAEWGLFLAAFFSQLGK